MAATLFESLSELKEMILNNDHPRGDPYPLIPGPRKEDKVYEKIIFLKIEPNVNSRFA